MQWSSTTAQCPRCRGIQAALYWCRAVDQFICEDCYERVEDEIEEEQRVKDEIEAEDLSYKEQET